MRLTTSNLIFQLNSCGCSPYVTSSLTREWVCRLKLLLVLASAVILRSESRGFHNHILLSQIRDSPNVEGQVPVFIFTRNSYTPRQWVPIFSPPTTRRTTVEVFDPASTRDKINPTPFNSDMGSGEVGRLGIVLSQSYLQTLHTEYLIGHWPHKNRRVQQLPRNSCLLRLHYSNFKASCDIALSLAYRCTAVFQAFPP
jgi:hypothetical protein